MTAGRTINSLSVHWGTPHKYVQAVKDVLNGNIHLDPCSNEFSIVDAVTEWKLPNTDGLRQIWDFPTIYVNPPYGRDPVRKTRIKDWLRKCSESNAQFGSEVLALIPVAANTSHWKEYVWPTARAICFLYDTRLRFLEDGLDKGKGAPMACCMVYWGNDFEKFRSIFGAFGAVIDLSKATIIGRYENTQLELTARIG